jgi:transposase-like protein
MKPTSPSKEHGAIFIAPAIAMATWWILCRAEKRDLEAAKRFFKQAIEVADQPPERVTTDGHNSSPRAIHETLGSDCCTEPTAISTIGSNKITAG